MVEDPGGEAAHDNAGKNSHSDGIIQRRERRFQNQNREETCNDRRNLILRFRERHDCSEGKQDVHIPEYDIPGRFQQRQIQHIVGSNAGKDPCDRHSGDGDEHGSA